MKVPNEHPEINSEVKWFQIEIGNSTSLPAALSDHVINTAIPLTITALTILSATTRLFQCSWKFLSWISRIQFADDSRLPKTTASADQVEETSRRGLSSDAATDTLLSTI